MSDTSFDSQDKVLLVISGGGCPHIENALGCIKAIRETGVKFDMAYGTSAGALVASMLMSKEQDVDAVINMLRTTPISDWIKIRPWQAIKSIIGKSNYVADNTGLKEMLLTNITTDAINKTRVAISKMSDDGKFVRSRLVKGYPAHVLASMSFQGVFPPVRISGSLYADGGVNDNVPMPKYMDIPKYKHIYILIAPSSHLVPSFKRWPFIDKILDLVDNTMNREVAQIEQMHFEEAPNITILRPDKYVDSAKFLGWSNNFEQISASYIFASEQLSKGTPAVFPELGYKGGEQ